MYLVTNISGKVQNMPKKLSHIAAAKVSDNWAIGETDVVDDEMINYYTAHTTVFSVGPQVQVTEQKYNTNAAVASATLAAADVTGGSKEVDLNLTGTLTGASNAQLPTVAAVVTALGFTPVVGKTYKLRIMNSSAGAFAWTVTTNTGWTLAGTMTIAQNTYRDFIVTFASAAAATLQSIGGAALIAV